MNAILIVMMVLESFGCWEALKRPSEGWDAAALAGYVQTAPNASPLIDPESILTERTSVDIRDIIRSIRQITVAFIVMSKVAPFSRDFSVRAEDLRRLADRLLQDSPQLKSVRDKGLLIIHSILDEQELWWAAPAARPLLANPAIAKLKKFPRRDLGVHDINQAFTRLFGDLKRELRQPLPPQPQEPKKSAEWLWLVAVLIFVGLFINQNRLEHLMTSRLDQIRALEGEKVELEQFAKETCGLCLVPLRCKLDSERFKPRQPGEQNPVFNCPKAKSSSVIDAKAHQEFEYILDPNAYVMDDCGHRFHGECLKAWSKVSEDCPICELAAKTGQANASAKSDSLGQILTAIQQVLYRGRFEPEETMFLKSHGRLPGFLDFLFADNPPHTELKGKVI